MRFQDPLILRFLLYTLFNLAIHIAVTSTDEQLPTLQMFVVFPTSGCRTPADLEYLNSTAYLDPTRESKKLLKKCFTFPRFPHHGNLELCSWHIHSSNGLARWVFGDCVHWTITRIPSHYIIYIGKKLYENPLPHQKKIRLSHCPPLFTQQIYPTSVTGCSTCNRGFNSKKQKVSFSGPGSVPKSATPLR